MLTDNRAGVIAGIHGLGGIGKTELAFTFAWAYASVYPGGRFYIKCEYHGSLRDAVNISLGDAPQFHAEITRCENALNRRAHFAAIYRCLHHRLDTFGTVLLVLDNVDDMQLLHPQQTDSLTKLGPNLHLLATTRLADTRHVRALTLGQMKHEEAVALLDKFRPIKNELERMAAESIVRQLDGFALAVELVAAKLAITPDTTYGAWRTTSTWMTWINWPKILTSVCIGTKMRSDCERRAGSDAQWIIATRKTGG